MMYSVLLLGLPALGIAGFAVLWTKMERDAITAPPVVAFFTIFASYGALLLVGVSEMFDTWSAMHSLATAGLLLIGIPWLLVQGARLRRSGQPSRYHRAAANLSLGFPV